MVEAHEVVLSSLRTLRILNFPFPFTTDYCMGNRLYSEYDISKSFKVRNRVMGQEKR